MGRDISICCKYVFVSLDHSTQARKAVRSGKIGFRVIIDIINTLTKDKLNNYGDYSNSSLLVRRGTYSNDPHIRVTLR